MKIVRRGDIWDFTSNNGHIERRIKSVASGVVSYTCNGKFQQCQMKTFQSWARGAELIFAEDWSGRDSKIPGGNR